MPNRIINEGMSVEQRKPKEDDWKTYTKPGPRVCIAVIRSRRKRTRRAQRNRFVRTYVDTVFSLQYKANDPAYVPKVSFHGRHVHVEGFNGNFVMPQLEWISK